ncbi:MAG: two-component system, cell cycle sensor histidine kinase and response regulator CckA [Actinomycetota bacterium]|nr:two-component system, cell cycle sensor histidine kinase and response regulator CckA [Actinomycetota bacterium]
MGMQVAGATRRPKKESERSSPLNHLRRIFPQGGGLSDASWEVRHRVIVWIAWAHAAVLPIVGIANGKMVLHAFAESSVVAVAAWLAGRADLSRNTRMLSAVFALITSSALLVHFSGGLIEMHFHFFVMVGIVTLYQSWSPFLFAIAYVVVHHGVMGSISPENVFNHPAAIAHPWTWAAVHGFFILGMSGAGLAAWKFSEDAQRRTVVEERKRFAEAEIHLAKQEVIEEKLRRNEERFRSLVQHSSDCVCVFSAEGDVVYVSPAVKHLMGYTPDEYKELMGPTMVHPDDLERVGATFQRVVQNPGSSERIEARALTKGGNWAWLDIAYTNLLDDPPVGGIVANFHDITQRRSMEMQLNQSQKMDAIGRLAGGIAHDFNNLLSVISNTADFLSEELAEDAELKSDVDEIQTASRRAALLVSQLLTFSRQEKDEALRVDLNEVVEETRTMLTRTIGEDIEVDVHLEEDLWPVRIDPGKAGQVLMNLAVNARDAMGSGGKLSLTTRNATLSVQDVKDLPKDGEYVVIEVRDTGTGIPEDKLQQIFEPFFTTKPRGSGTGLGLSTVFGIVKGAEGAINVESRLGQGTRFAICLPRDLGESSVVLDVAPATSNGGHGESILLVEDEEGVRRVAIRILEGAGYRVLGASSGQQALEIFKSETVDLVLTDVVMPGMSGRQLVTTIHSLKPSARTVYMSGYTDDVIAEHGVIDGEALIQKPFNSDALLQAVRQVLDRDSIEA